MHPAEPDPRLWWLAADDVDGLRRELDSSQPWRDAVPPAKLGLHATGEGPARLGIVDPDERKVELARRLAAKGTSWRGRSDIWFTPKGLAQRGDQVAFVFPGVEPAFGAEATDLPALATRLGLDPPPLSEATLAHRTASIYRLGIFLDQVMRTLGVEPDVVAGHSIGEWSGSVAAGMVPPDRAEDLLTVLDLDDVELPDVDFAALGAGADAVSGVLAGTDGAQGIDGIEISHDNCPNQSVICGPPAAVDRALARLREANVLGYRLDFRSGFHTSVIAPALELFRAHADRLPIGPPRIPMWSATSVAPYPPTREGIIELHLRHLVEPVRFRPMVERLYRDAGARVFVQVGIGSLTNFVDDTLQDRDHACVPLLTANRSAIGQLHRALTALWVEGVDVRWEPLGAAAQRPSASPPHPRTAAVAADVGAGPRLATPSPGTTKPTVTTTPDTSDPGGGASAPAPVAPAMPATGDRTRAARSPAHVGAVDTWDRAGATPVHAAMPATRDQTRAVRSPALVGALDMVGSAARAGQQVIEALASRLAPARAETRTDGAVATAAVPTPVTVPPPAAPARSTGPSRTTWPTSRITVRRRLSLQTMPETLDHTLYEQPGGWDDPSDLFPIVAMTTQIELLQDIAAPYGGGRDVIEVLGVRNLRWLDISTPLDLDVTVDPQGDDVLQLALGAYCRASVRLGCFPPAPQHDPRPLLNLRSTVHTAQEMFERRLMFHGPRFQGIVQLGPIGDDGILGEFHTLATPGSLLDNMGKLVAYWVMDRRGWKEGPLPIGLDRIELFGPQPPPGVDLHCDVRIVDLQEDLVRADGQIIAPDGTVWCRVEGWTSHIFHLDDKTELLYREPSHSFVTEPQPGDWSLLRERWPGGAARDFTARRFLRRREREHYEGLNLLEQRRWLIRMVVAKDAVRQWLWDGFGTPSYPVEIVLVPDGEHCFRVDSHHLETGQQLYVTLSSLDWLAVAVVGDGQPRDIEAREIADDTDPTAAGHELADAVRARNPSARVATAIPDDLTTAAGHAVAVAWTY